MWILECDDQRIFKSKRLWLRPGKSYLFGRTKQPGGSLVSNDYVIDHKSVSRQHLTLSISAVKPGEGVSLVTTGSKLFWSTDGVIKSLVHVRTEIELKDNKTKAGTTIDGERHKGEGVAKVLKEPKHTFKLGSAEALFTLTWQPVVLSYSFASKELKGGKDPLIGIRGRLEELDIKAIIPYIIGKTTHVVASKRNTAKGLQALINAKYIVTDSFVDALVYATTPADLDELESLSPLEEDFDANWPNPIDHLPPRSKEPNERPSEFFAPNLHRSNIFEGYTFIFCDPTQFETLQAPITNGGGKALEFTLVSGKTTVEDIVQHVKSVAGEKGIGEFEDGTEGKGVVVVKFRGEKSYQDWAIGLGQQVALALDQRLIEQSEFLDAILTNNASILRRPLPDTQGDEATAPPPTKASVRIPSPTGMQDVVSQGAPQAGQAEISQPALKRPRIRGRVAPIFKGFDEDFDASTLRTLSKKSDDSIQANGRSSQRTTRAVSFADLPTDRDTQENDYGTTQANSSGKRPPPSDEENEEEMVDKLLPAAAAMKRRKIQDEHAARVKGISSEPSFGKPQMNVQQAEGKKKPVKKVNIQEIVRERREAEDEASRRDEESLKETLEASDIEQMRNLAVIEEMEIPKRSKRLEIGEGTNDRWDEHWNGRKNFKNFRRRGEGAHAHGSRNVIVPLEEVKKKDFGIGEEYWLESEKSKKKKREDVERTIDAHIQSQSQPLVTANGRTREEVEDTEMPQVMDAIDTPRMTMSGARISHGEFDTAHSGDLGSKRAAPANGRLPPTKKQKMFPVNESESESEEDELRFRFKKRT